MTARWYSVNKTDPEMSVDVVATGTTDPGGDISVKIGSIALWNRKDVIIRLEQIIRRIEDGRLDDAGLT